MLNKIRIKKKKNSGFTLIEIIVVLLIMGILLAIAIPSILGYVNKTDDLKNELRLRNLNVGSQSLKVYQYAKGTLKEDIFNGITDNQARQDSLLAGELIDEYQTNVHDDTDYFYWDVKEQVWKLDENADAPSDVVNQDKTILGELTNPANTKKGDYNKDQSYVYGDLVLKDGIWYKCMKDVGQNGTPGDFNYANFWKPIQLDFHKNNSYEKNDIIKWGDDYYKCIDPKGFYEANIGYDYSDEKLISKYFTKQKWNGHDFE